MMVETYVAAATRAERPIDRPLAKIGGLPVFVEERPWPLCRCCGQPLDFYAQFSLKAPMRLSEQYSMAYIFACPGRPYCHSSRGEGCDVVGEVHLQRAASVPSIPTGEPVLPDYALTFTRVEEPLTTVVLFDDDLDGDLAALVHWETKLGGVPIWWHTSCHPSCPACGGPMRFIFQLSTGQLGEEDWLDLDGSHFGKGYVFLCERDCDGRGALMIWQHG